MAGPAGWQPVSYQATGRLPAAVNSESHRAQTGSVPDLRRRIGYHEIP